jgi:hypothetical protein
MSAWLARLSWPARVRIAGALLALAVYFGRAVHLPHHTAVGMEQRLFAARSFSARLKESPHGRRWLVVPVPEDQSASTPPSWLQTALAFHWPGGVSPRRITPFQPSGTWELRGTALHRLWRFPAEGWLTESRLWCGEAGVIAAYEGPIVLDLKTGRRLRGTGLVPDELLYASEEYETDTGEEEPDVEDPLAEPGHALASTQQVGGKRLVDGRAFYLVQSQTAPGLYAVSDDPAPRVLPLASGGKFVALSKDGRTLFFLRSGALCRLDLRKPLPALLDEVTVPELPDPLEAK